MSFASILALGRADDPRCQDELPGFDDPELVGELIVQLYRSGTKSGLAAARSALLQPYRRGYWQGFKRIFKLAEPTRDAATFGLCAWVLDQAPRSATPSWRTVAYMQRRCYRHLKHVAIETPGRFVDHLEELLPRFEPQRPSVLLARLLRAVGVPTDEPSQRFVARLENPFAVESDPEEHDELLELPEEKLTKARLPKKEEEEDEEEKKTEETPARWKGPIFAELWLRDPERLVRLLERTRQEDAARAIVRLLNERAGDALLGVPLERFYGLLAHPVREAWRLGLSQIAGRVRQSLLRFDELLPLFERAQGDWNVIEDLLYVLDDERAGAERDHVAPTLAGLVVAHRDEAGVAALVSFLRRHLAGRLTKELFKPEAAISLLESARPDVRELGRGVLTGQKFSNDQLVRILGTPYPDEDPEGAHALLRAIEWKADALAKALDELPESGFRALERAVLQTSHAPELATALVARPVRRTRSVGLELLAAAIGRGESTIVDVVPLLSADHEDVIVWAREKVRDAAKAGKLPNEALYRMLDATALDVTGFARRIVREHLERFEVVELIVFCAESPDAATADLGIELYEKRKDLDLKKLVPMFRILLYKVATARKEKERLYGTLRRFALETEENARLVVDVIGEFRRTEAKIDFARAVTLLALVSERFPGVPVPFEEAANVWGGGSGGSPPGEAIWSSR
jgi:hypothetical protein